jgi:cation transport regulator ChaC
MQETGAATDRVHGVLFSIAAAELEALDKAEGAVGKNAGYKRTEVAVTTDDGSRQAALSYVALKSDAALRPYHWYKAFVVAGAVEHGLPPVYIEWLRTFESQPDDDAARRAENEAILFET